MRKALRYNELDELAWEEKHGCIDHACGDECWDQVVHELQNEYEDENWVEYHEHLHENPQYEEFAEDDETGPGIFGNELNHEQNAKSEPSGVVSNGKVFGHGEKDEIIRTIFDLLAPCRDYHFEFGFFEAK